MQSVYHYKSSIVNIAKKRYADDYWAYLTEREENPDYNKYTDRKGKSLSYMAAQAVRIRLDEYWKEDGRNT